MEGLEESNQTPKKGTPQNKSRMRFVVVIFIVVFICGGMYFIISSEEPDGLQLIDYDGGSLPPISVLDNQSVTIRFLGYKPTPAPMDVKVILESNIGEVIELTFPSAPTGQNLNLVVSGAFNSSCTAIYHDYVYQENQINNGDYILVFGLQPGTNYTVSIYHFPSNSFAPPGPIDFTTPP